MTDTPTTNADELLWAYGQFGNSDIVTFNGEDIVGVGEVGNQFRAQAIIDAHNSVVNRLRASSADTSKASEAVAFVKFEGSGTKSFSFDAAVLEKSTGFQPVYLHPANHEPPSAAANVSESPIPQWAMDKARSFYEFDPDDGTLNERIHAKAVEYVRLTAEVKMPTSAPASGGEGVREIIEELRNGRNWKCSDDHNRAYEISEKLEAASRARTEQPLPAAAVEGVRGDVLLRGAYAYILARGGMHVTDHGCVQCVGAEKVVHFHGSEPNFICAYHRAVEYMADAPISAPSPPASASMSAGVTAANFDSWQRQIESVALAIYDDNREMSDALGRIAQEISERARANTRAGVGDRGTIPADQINLEELRGILKPDDAGDAKGAGL